MKLYRPHSLTPAILTAMVLILTTGCSDESSSEPTPTTTTESPESKASAAFERYWDAYIEISNSGEVNAEELSGVADGKFVEEVLGTLAQQADSGVVRVGEPDFGEFETQVNGAAATSVVCMDEREWGARQGGEDLPPPGDDFPPTEQTATVEFRDGEWIVTDVDSEEGAECSVD